MTFFFLNRHILYSSENSTKEKKTKKQYNICFILCLKQRKTLLTGVTTEFIQSKYTEAYCMHLQNERVQYTQYANIVWSC